MKEVSVFSCESKDRSAMMAMYALMQSSDNVVKQDCQVLLFYLVKNWTLELRRTFSSVLLRLPYISAALLTLSSVHELINPEDLNLPTNNA